MSWLSWIFTCTSPRVNENTALGTQEVWLYHDGLPEGSKHWGLLSVSQPSLRFHKHELIMQSSFFECFIDEVKEPHLVILFPQPKKGSWYSSWYIFLIFCKKKNSAETLLDKYLPRPKSWTVLTQRKMCRLSFSCYEFFQSSDNKEEF